MAVPGADELPDKSVETGKTLPTVRRRVRAVASVLTTILAFGLVWFALVGPDEVSRLSPAAFLRIPIEGLILVALAVVLPPRARRIVAVVIGTILGLLTIIKILDMGFYVALGRPFDPVGDWSYFGSAMGLLSVSIGHPAAVVSLVVAAIVVVAVLVFTPLAMLRLTRLAAEFRVPSIRTVAALSLVWILCAVFGASVASASAAGAVFDEGRQVHSGLVDQRQFVKAAAADPYRTVPSDDLLTALRGKDVIVAFVESYGAVAVQGSSFSPQVDAVLNAGTGQLRAAGYSSESAFLTSPTFGGISWLAHSTLESGLWVNNQERYNDLITSSRETLTSDFKRAGWRTVADVPANEKDWPEGKTFYGYDQIYDDRNVGYNGPRFSYATMPDQYILSAFQRLELAEPGHTPVMAEIDLVSSHTPWAPLPQAVPWSAVGDGSIFNPMPAEGQSATSTWKSSDKVRAAYGQSIQYSLGTLMSFMETYGNKNLVLILLGDHQPATIVSGQGASHNVPISIISSDPAVMAHISDWNWTDGMLPSPQAPVWPMDDFRDRFLTAFGSPAPH